MTPLQREALQMCLEYIETDAHERRHVRWKINEALAEPATEESSAVQPAAQPQQEPVNEVRCPECGYLTKHTEHIGCLRNQLNAINAFEQRNFAIVNMDKAPQPPQRKPLTDEQIKNIAAWTLFPIAFARAIEAAHGIKENT